MSNYVLRIYDTTRISTALDRAEGFRNTKYEVLNFCSCKYVLVQLKVHFITSLSSSMHLIATEFDKFRSLGEQQEGLAVASIARDVVEMTPPRDDNAR